MKEEEREEGVIELRTGGKSFVFDPIKFTWYIPTRFFLFFHEIVGGINRYLNISSGGCNDLRLSR